MNRCLIPGSGVGLAHGVSNKLTVVLYGSLCNKEKARVCRKVHAKNYFFRLDSPSLLTRSCLSYSKLDNSDLLRQLLYVKAIGLNFSTWALWLNT